MTMDPPTSPQDDAPELPDRVEDLPGWREPPRAPEIPEELTRAIHKPKSAEAPRVKGTGNDMSDTARAFGIALDFIATVAVGALIGWGLGKWLGGMPGFVLGGLAIGMIAAFVRVVRATQAAERREADARKRKPGSGRT